LIEVLLVEDCPGDVRLMREAFKEAKVHINLHVASDGSQAMAFLGREGQHSNAPRPDLILLDLYLPKKDGREVLDEIKESPTLNNIPVVIMTTSASEADSLRSSRLHVNCYLSKPVDPDRLPPLFWFSPCGPFLRSSSIRGSTSVRVYSSGGISCRRHQKNREEKLRG
jgi:two-component system, chemotaxis family, response regulator Rcp1